MRLPRSARNDTRNLGNWGLSPISEIPNVKIQPLFLGKALEMFNVKARRLFLLFFAEYVVDFFHVEFFGPVVIVYPVLLLLDVGQLSVTETAYVGHAQYHIC